MSAKRKDGEDELVELMRTLIITQLGLAGVKQKDIRAILKCDMKRVSEVMKIIAPRDKGKKRKGEE